MLSSASIERQRPTAKENAEIVDVTDDRLELYRLHAEICKVLTDPKRLMLLTALRAGDRSVGELALAIGVSLPNASQHLAVLRTAGLIEGRRIGTTVLYRLAEPAIADACDIISAIVARRLQRAVSPAAEHATNPTLEARA
jgi:ArsR family transcriptional regulator, virulence genes transcriptional regulator